MKEKDLEKLKAFLQKELLDLENIMLLNRSNQLIGVCFYRQANLKSLLDLVLKKLKE